MHYFDRKWLQTANKSNSPNPEDFRLLFCNSESKLVCGVYVMFGINRKGPFRERKEQAEHYHQIFSVLL